MWSTNSRFLVAFALIALANLAIGLDEIDLKSQRGRSKPLVKALFLHENLVLRYAEPDPSTDRIETVDSQDLTTSLRNVVGSQGVTLPPVATGPTVHTGGVGGSPTTATAPTTTDGVLGPNTKGSVPSGGNVVPDTASASGGSTGTQTATKTSTSVSGSTPASASASAAASTSASASAGVSTSASTTVSETASASASASAAASANQAESSQSQPQESAAADNIVGVGWVLCVVVVGIGWLL